MSRYLILIWMLAIVLSSKGQSVVSQQLIGQLTSSISRKSQQCGHLLEKRTDKMLRRMERIENRMRKKLMKQDSLLASGIFDTSMMHIHHLRAQWKYQPVELKESRYIDTLQNTLQYLHAMPALKHVSELETRMAQTAQIQSYIKLHRDQLSNQLSKYAHLSGKLDKAVGNYNAQVAACKELFHDKKKAMKKALSLLKKIPAYNNFLHRNESIARLVNGAEVLPGLQTREQVQQMINERLSQGAITGNPLNTAQGQLSQVQQRIPSWRSNSSDMDMPAYKPDGMRAKSFLQRLEVGYNFQPQQSTGIMPGMLNIGGSLGYRINEKSVIGIGGAYLLGLGRPVKDIKFSHQGIGIRSFVDVKLKASFWLSGGMEYNYMHVFSSIREIDLWQKSGLIGVMRKMKVNNKDLKTQLLWDVLSYKQVPQSPPLKFRIGYNLK